MTTSNILLGDLREGFIEGLGIEHGLPREGIIFESPTCPVVVVKCDRTHCVVLCEPKISQFSEVNTDLSTRKKFVQYDPISSRN